MSQQEYIRESVEEYMSRFYTIADILGGEKPCRMHQPAIV